MKNRMVHFDDTIRFFFSDREESRGKKFELRTCSDETTKEGNNGNSEADHEVEVICF